MVQFEYSNALAMDLGKGGLRIVSFTILIGWPRILAKVASERSVGAVWWAGRRYGQKQPQKAQFQHFGGPIVDISRSVLKRLCSSIMVGRPPM